MFAVIRLLFRYDNLLSNFIKRFALVGLLLRSHGLSFFFIHVICKLAFKCILFP